MICQPLPIITKNKKLIMLFSVYVLMAVSIMESRDSDRAKYRNRKGWNQPDSEFFTDHYEKREAPLDVFDILEFAQRLRKYKRQLKEVGVDLGSINVMHDEVMMFLAVAHQTERPYQIGVMMR